MKHIQKLHLLLVTLMAEGFPNRSLLVNKKLFTDLKEFQAVIFDKKQRYGNPNYKPVPLEEDLRNIENKLAEVIYLQLGAININKLTPEQLVSLHKDFGTYCCHRDVNKNGAVWELQSVVRSQILLNACSLDNKEEKIRFFYFVVNNSNSTHQEHKEARRLLDEIGYNEEEVHIQEFGERPK